MDRSRRRFLKLVALGGVAAGTTTVVVGWLSYTALRRRFYRLGSSVPPGPLDPSTGRTLLAVVDTLIGTSFDAHHYQDFFSWYAATAPGYRGLYERTAVMLDELAVEAGSGGFADLGYAERRGLIDGLLEVQRSKLRRVWTGALSRDTVLFNRYVVQRVLKLYRQTDAWVHLGYKAWQGQPRGLELYTRAPPVLDKKTRSGNE